MRRAFLFGILTIAALALVASVAFASDAKDCKLNKTSATTANSVNPHTSCQGAGHPAQAAVAETENHCAVRTICVKGMTSVDSEEAVKAELAKVPGVVEVIKVSHEACEAVVKVDPSKTQDVQLTKALTDKGYQAEMVTIEAKSDQAGSKAPVCPFSGTPGCAAIKKAGVDCQAGKAVKPETETEKKKDESH